MFHQISLLFIFQIAIVLYASNKIPQVGEFSPNVILYSLDGKLFNLSKETNKANKIISFSATYCKPCKEEIKEFIKLQKEIGEDKLKIYLIFIDSEIDKIKSYVSENKINLPILHDKHKIVYTKYGVSGLPVSFLINKDGIIIFIAKGYRKENIEKIRQKIKK